MQNRSVEKAMFEHGVCDSVRVAVFLLYCRDFGCSTRALALWSLRDHRPGTSYGHFWDLYGLDPWAFVS